MLKVFRLSQAPQPLSWLKHLAALPVVGNSCLKLDHRKVIHFHVCSFSCAFGYRSMAELRLNGVPVETWSSAGGPAFAFRGGSTPRPKAWIPQGLQRTSDPNAAPYPRTVNPKAPNLNPYRCVLNLLHETQHTAPAQSFACCPSLSERASPIFLCVLSAVQAASFCWLRGGHRRQHRGRSTARSPAATGGSCQPNPRARLATDPRHAETFVGGCLHLCFF